MAALRATLAKMKHSAAKRSDDWKTIRLALRTNDVAPAHSFRARLWIRNRQGRAFSLASPFIFGAHGLKFQAAIRARRAGNNSVQY
jgi:hypothetical protein